MLPMARSSGSALPAFTVGAFNGGDLLRVRCDFGRSPRAHPSAAAAVPEPLLGVGEPHRPGGLNDLPRHSIGGKMPRAPRPDMIMAVFGLACLFAVAIGLVPSWPSSGAPVGAFRAPMVRSSLVSSRPYTCRCWRLTWDLQTF